jgi:ABC-type antimicrobial peptide transport system ATPase subunit
VTFRFKESIGTRAVAVKQSSLNLRHKTILGILAKSPEGISIQQIMAGLSNPPSQRMLQKDLKFLKEQELILVKGSGRSSVWALKDE